MENIRLLTPQSKLVNFARSAFNPETNAETMSSFNPPSVGGKHISKEEIIDIFEKKFQYQRSEEASDIWQLPPPTKLFGEYYQFESLQQLKKQLNDVKSKLNNYSIEEWRGHTRRKDPAGEIPWCLKTETHAEFVTVAWCKLFECLHKYPLVKSSKLNTLHLCEAPGAFIAALNHYLYSRFNSHEIQWKWLATTMNPYYEGNPLDKIIIDDRFILPTLGQWLFHEDFSGSIMSRTNIEHMQQQCASRFDGEVVLITADGSVDCVDKPDYQEEYVGALHLAEISAALSVLADGGCFVIKMFTLFESASVCKMYLLNCVFKEVHVYKPATSKRGNSEVYVICLGFKKNTPYLTETLDLMLAKFSVDSTNLNDTLPLFARSQLPQKFLFQHEICARLFMNLQIRAIETNIHSYKFNPRHDAKRAHVLRSLVCQEFYERYNVQPIPAQLRVVPPCAAQVQKKFHGKIKRGSFTERKIVTASPIHTTEQIYLLLKTVNELERSFLASDENHFGVLLAEQTRSTDTPAPPALKVYRGTTIAQLHMSLFAAEQILWLQHKIRTILTADPIFQQSPKCIINYACGKKNQERFHVLNYNESGSDNFSLTQKQFFVRVIKQILEQRPIKVEFQNLPFLTHFSVSVLRYLSLHVFDRLTISTETTFSITLSIEITNETFYTQDQAKIALCPLLALLESDEKVLCVLDITQLRGNSFCEALTHHNNLLLLRNFNIILKH